jgi:prepilin-type processing-associated H-X9-DG protein/prepilin-type N-terminal cleavage/methylation domain-containing protein
MEGLLKESKTMRIGVRNKVAFTLVELLVVIAIIALLLAILMPSLKRVRGMATQTVCGTRMKQLALADLMYAQHYGTIASPCRFAFGLREVWNGNICAYIGTDKTGWDDFRKYVNYGKLKGDRRYKAFTTGDLYPFLKNGDVFVCPGIPKTGAPANSTPFGFDKMYGYTPRWNYIGNPMPALCQGGTIPATWVINPDVVKPGPGRVICFMDADWKGAHNTLLGVSKQLGRGQANFTNIHDGGGNFSFFDGHVEYMKQSAFCDKLDALKDRPGTMDFFGGYWEMGQYDWAGNPKTPNP